MIQNYRSHEKILEFPSNEFYDRQLIAANTANRQSFVNWELLPKKVI
jgi:superfamily I DNA and/or RNA helicase